MTVALIGLPLEIIEIILTYLQTEQATLAAVCGVSRSLYSIVTPCLYRVIRHKENEPNNPRRFPRLLRSLLHNPALARHVVEMQFTLPGAEQEDVSCLSKADWDLVRSLVARMYKTGLFSKLSFFQSNQGHTSTTSVGGSEEDWYEGVCEGRWDTIFCLVLYCCSSIQELLAADWGRSRTTGYVPNVDYFEFFMYGVALSQAIPEEAKAELPDLVRLLPQYRQAQVVYRNTGPHPNRATPLRYLVPFLFCPTLEYFRGSIRCDSHRDLNRWIHLQFGVKRLVVEKGSNLTGRLLWSLLNCCVALEEFVLELEDTEEYDDSYMNMRELMKFNSTPGGLLESKKSLTRLELASGFEGIHRPSHCNQNLTIGSLVDFEVLTHLTIRLQFLIWNGRTDRDNLDGSDEAENQPPTELCEILPRSLEFLSITTQEIPDLDSTEFFHSEEIVLRKQEPLLLSIFQFQDLVSKKKSTVPKLRQIELDGMLREAANSGVMRFLKKTCEVNEVHLVAVVFHESTTSHGARIMDFSRVSL